MSEAYRVKIQGDVHDQKRTNKAIGPGPTSEEIAEATRDFLEAGGRIESLTPEFSLSADVKVPISDSRAGYGGFSGDKGQETPRESALDYIGYPTI